VFEILEGDKVLGTSLDLRSADKLMLALNDQRKLKRVIGELRELRTLMNALQGQLRPIMTMD
jgi:hypothetical protein